MNLKPVLKRFDLLITEQSRTFSRTYELEKNIRNIRGVLLTSDKDDLLYLRGSQKIEVNKDEIFPENYESKLLMSGINVPPKQRFYELENVCTGNGYVKLEYKDSEDGRTRFEPYRVSLYLLCEMEEN